MSESRKWIQSLIVHCNSIPLAACCKKQKKRQNRHEMRPERFPQKAKEQPCRMKSCWLAMRNKQASRITTYGNHKNRPACLNTWLSKGIQNSDAHLARAGKERLVRRTLILWLLWFLSFLCFLWCYLLSLYIYIYVFFTMSYSLVFVVFSIPFFAICYFYCITIFLF